MVVTTHENAAPRRREAALRKGRAGAVLEDEGGVGGEVVGGRSLPATTMMTVNEAVFSDILVVHSVYNMYL